MHEKKKTSFVVKGCLTGNPTEFPFNFQFEGSTYILGFMVLFCHSFGDRSERPRALQLLIKMLIRSCLK